MKKRTKAKKATAKPKARAAAKPAARTRGKTPAARPAAAPGRREQVAIEAAKYTPAPLQSDGWPAFRYPL